MAFGVPFHAVMAALVDLFDLSQPDQSKLLARLRNMQREGFPPGINVGRGVKVAYGIEQLTAVLFYHTMIDAGFPPDFAIRAYVTHRDLILTTALQAEFAFDRDQEWPGSASELLVLTGRVLRPEDTTARDERPFHGHLQAQQLIEIHSGLPGLIASPSGVHMFDIAGSLAQVLRYLSKEKFTSDADALDALRSLAEARHRGES